MTDDVETTADVDEVADDVEPEDAEAESGDVESVEDDPAEGLKKALAAERKAHRDEVKRRKAAEQALADKDRPAEEAAIEQARREARDEAKKTSDARIVRAELKAALAGKVSNPAIALRLIDTSEIEVDEDGEVDADALNAAVESLLAEAPELAVKQERFQGGADQGPKGKNSRPAQMTRTEFDRIKSDPAAVMKAKAEGRLNALLGITS